MTWNRFPPNGPALYRFGPFTLRPLIAGARADTGTYPISVLWVNLRRDTETEWRLGSLKRLTPTVHDVLAYTADWIERKDSDIASTERMLARNAGGSTSSDVVQAGRSASSPTDEQNEPEYDEAAIRYFSERLDWLRLETAAVRLEYKRLRDLVDQGQPIPNTSSNLVAEVIDPRTLAPAPFDTISTRYILEVPAFDQMHQVTSAEPVLGEEIARHGSFHIVRHLGYRIVGRPYLFSDPEPGLWPPPTQDQLRQGLSLQLDTTDGRQVVLFEGWSDGDFSLSALLACVDELLEQQERAREMRRRASEKFQTHGATDEEIRRLSAGNSRRDFIFQEVALARVEVARD